MDVNYMADTESDNLVRAYFQQIRHMPLLDAQQERELSKRVLAGDDAARQELVKYNLKLVVKIAKVYMSSGMPLLDLIQEGNVGLIQAASKYDYRKNVRFSTYSAPWIVQRIIRFVDINKRAIPLPHRKEIALRSYYRTVSELNQKLQRRPRLEEISKVLPLKIQEIKKLVGAERNVYSLNSEIAHSDLELMDVYQDYSYCPETETITKQVKEDTRHLLENLMEREREILLRRFCFIDSKKRTLRSLALEYGVSKETVRQIEKRALAKLRESCGEELELLRN